MTQKIILSIIIPAHDTKKILLNCLQSIYSQTKKINFETMVVDNASQDGSSLAVNKHFPQVKLLVNKTNLGFAQANNQALKQAQGKYILFLNSDTIILNQAIEQSLFFLQREKIDILGCQLLNQDKTIQPSAGFFPNLFNLFMQMLFLDDLSFINRLVKPYQQSRLAFYLQQQTVDWVTGAFLLMTKQVTDKIKGFNNHFFMYSEEIEFCYRAKKAGFKVGYYPQVQVIHLKGRSSLNGFNQAVLGEYQGLKNFFTLHRSKWQLPFLKLLLKFGALIRVVIFGILGKEQQQRTYEKAFYLA